MLTADRNVFGFFWCSRWITDVFQVAGKSRYRTPWTTVLGIRNQQVAALDQKAANRHFGASSSRLRSMLI
jgi:hypothetical protein